MVQTATNISREKQYLQIAGVENQNITNDLTRSSENKFNASIIENTVFENVAPFFYKDRVRLLFTVSVEYKTRQAMLRGLIEFSRPRHFLFDYRFQQGTIETDIDIRQLSHLQLFLNKTSVCLKQEIQFRNVLKSVLAFENRYKREAAGVYSLLMAQ